jgi:hypothetical protein
MPVASQGRRTVIPLAASQASAGSRTQQGQFATRRRCRFTSTFRGACRSAPTAISTRMRCSRPSAVEGGAAIPEGRLPGRPDRRPRIGTAAGLGPPHRQRLFRWRDAQPALGRGVDDFWRPCAAACRCCRAPRSRWKPIREPLRPKNSPPFAPPASTACRSASRVSTRAPQGARPHPRRSRRLGRRSRLPPAISTISTST